MHRTHFRIVYLISFLFLTCTNQPQSVLLYQEVMDIHDAVMPKVHDIQKLSKQLEEKAKEENLNEGQKAEIQKTLQQLEAADKSMWDWMNGFKQPDPELSEEKTMELLTIEKEKISKVSDLMLGSINAAQELLAK